jgi:putative iron-regulated protein
MARMKTRDSVAVLTALFTTLAVGCGDTPAKKADGGQRDGSSAGSGGSGGSGGSSADAAAGGASGSGGATTDAAMDRAGAGGAEAGRTDGTGDGTGSAFPAAVAERVITTYRTLVYTTYRLSAEEATGLQTAIAAFVAAPDAAKLAAAKQAWVKSRLPYNQTDAYRFYDGPIDEPMEGPEAAINGWPLDENYVDYTRDLATAGLINDPARYPDLTPDKLVELNEVGGEKNLATGYHAIEFLLWGQDDAQPGMGAGKRPHTDFADGGTARNQARRRRFLTSVTELLVEHLEQVRDAWTPARPGNYAARFGVEVDRDSAHKDAKKDAVAKIIRGLGSVARAELSGERMTVAYKNRDQEDEHSCFSDTTWLDLHGNARGLKNVWTGDHEGMDLGPGLEDIYRAVDPALTAQIAADLDEAVTKMKALADNNEKAPFDVVIAEPDGSPNRATMLAAIKALKRVADGLAKGATAMGLNVAFEKPSEEI